jgi:hypothetical protein
LEAIEKTSNMDTFHGDAHKKNVLVRIRKIDYEDVLELKLCDFGTSVFSGKDQSFERHWRVVRETVLNCTSKMKSVDYALQVLEDCEEQIQVAQTEMKDEIKKGKVYINGRALVEPYLAEPIKYSFGPVVVPNDSLLVLGDNRNNSYDSHEWNVWLTRDRLMGKAFATYWPINHIKLLDRGVSFE